MDALQLDKLTTLVHKKVSASLILMDIIVLSVICYLAYVANEAYAFTLTDFSLPIYFAGLTFAIIGYFFAKGHFTSRTPWWNQVHNVLLVSLVLTLFDFFIFDKSHFVYLSVFILFKNAILFLALLAGRQVVYYVMTKLKLWNVRTVLIGDIDTTTDVLYAFYADRYAGYSPEAAIIRDRKEKTFDIENVPATYKDIDILDYQTDLEKYVQEHKDHFFVICLETFRGEEREKFLMLLNNLEISYAAIPPISRMSLNEMEPHIFFGYDIMLLHSKTAYKPRFKLILKRMMDVVLSAGALVALAPVVLIVAMKLKADKQGGSIFYGGERVGRNGAMFKCWKFRTMQPDSDYLIDEMLKDDPAAALEWEKYRKIKGDDPRIVSKTAKFIRKKSIDEVPQLWNVLKGDMSLIGPRPILEDEISIMGDAFHFYKKVRPGISGLWQVSGRNDTSFERRVYMDSWYIRNWALWGDIVIMFKTVKVIFGGSGSY